MPGPWEADVDLDAEVPTLTVTGTVVRAEGRLVQQPKLSPTRRSARSRSAFVVTAICEALDLGLDGGPDALVFPSTRATPRSPSRMRDQLRVAQASIGTTVTRTTSAGPWRRRSRTPRRSATRPLLGHADEGTTVRRYVRRTHIAPDLRVVIDQLVQQAAADVSPGKPE